MVLMLATIGNEENVKLKERGVVGVLRGFNTILFLMYDKFSTLNKFFYFLFLFLNAYLSYTSTPVFFVYTYTVPKLVMSYVWYWVG